MLISLLATMSLLYGCHLPSESRTYKITVNVPIATAMTTQFTAGNSSPLICRNDTHMLSFWLLNYAFLWTQVQSLLREYLQLCNLVNDVCELQPPQFSHTKFSDALTPKLTFIIWGELPPSKTRVVPCPRHKSSLPKKPPQNNITLNLTQCFLFVSICSPFGRCTYEFSSYAFSRKFPKPCVLYVLGHILFKNSETEILLSQLVYFSRNLQILAWSFCNLLLILIWWILQNLYLGSIQN